MKLKNTLILLTVVLSGINATAQCTASFMPFLDSMTRTATFSNQSTWTSSTSYKWDLGDGNGCTAWHPTHQYKSWGSYNVCLMIFDSKTSCRDTVCIQINVKKMSCNGNFDYWVKDSFNTFSFGTKGSDGTSYYFDFGDGTSYTGYSTIHQFKKNGTYKVCHVVSNSTSPCSDTVCKMVVADSTNPCSADFTAVQDSTNYLKWNMSAIDRTADYYIWSYTYNNVKSKDTSFTFPKSGKYYVSLEVSNSAKHCLDTLVKWIDVGCRADFTSQINNATKAVSFTNKSSSNITNYIWLFGDGTSSNARNPSHTYSSYGSFWVKLIAIDSVSKCEDTANFQISLISCDTGFAIAASNDSVYFSTTNSSKKVVWDMGDGTFYNGYMNGSHTYKNSGTYNVCFKAYCYVNDSFVSCTKVTVKIKSCRARFTAVIDPTNKYKVNFTNQTTNSSSMKYLWDFGDGQSSTATNPTHTYTTNGNFTVCLYTSDTVTKCYDTLCRALVFSSKYCAALFTDSMDVRDSLQYFFTNLSNKPLLCLWIFGDGTSSWSFNATHKYAKPGTYTVSLTTYDSSTWKCSDTLFRTITVGTGACQAHFTARLDSANQLKVYFTNLSSTSSSMKYYWDFGDGTYTPPYNSLTHPIHTYKTVGHYNVSLFILDSATKCRDSIYKFVNVGAQSCQAIFTDSVDWYNGGLPNARIIFDNLSSYTPTMIYLWDFGDGTSDSTSRFSPPIHTYKTSGKYNICLYISDSASRCYDTICRTITIPPRCTAFFTVAIDTTQKFKLFLINKSTYSPTMNYYWGFGDGSSSTSRNPTHKYNSFGKFRVCLTINDTAIKCTSTYCDTLGLDSNGKLLKAGGWELVVQDEDVQGIENLKLQSIKLYPNPVSDKLHLKFDGDLVKYERIEILNAQGQIVIGASLAEFHQSSPVVIETQNLSSGIYFLRMIGVERTESLKFIRE